MRRLTLFFFELQRLLDVVAQSVWVRIGEILDLCAFGYFVNTLEQAACVLKLRAERKGERSASGVKTS